MLLAGLCCLELSGGRNRKGALPSPHTCSTSHPTNRWRGREFPTGPHVTQLHSQGLSDGSEILDNLVAALCCLYVGRLCYVLMTPVCNIKLFHCELIRFLPIFLQRFRLDIRKFFLLRIAPREGIKNRLKKSLSGECTSGVSTSGVSAGLWLD